MSWRVYEHDEYAAWEGACRCAYCKPVPVDPDPDDNDERDEALEWGGVDI
jgi:hypothetical protein